MAEVVYSDLSDAPQTSVSLTDAASLYIKARHVYTPGDGSTHLVSPEPCFDRMRLI